MYPTDYGFAFGVIIADLYGRPLTLDSTYFTLELAEGNFTESGGLYYPTYTDLGYRLCTSSDLPGVSEEYIKRGLNSSMYWPINKRYRVGGNYLSKNFHYVSIILKRCIGAGWKPTAVIDAALQSNQIIIMQRIRLIRGQPPQRG